MQTKSCPESIKKVIVRAWGDEPVVMFLHHVENNRCYVGKENSDKVIGLPAEQVYLYDGTGFCQLREAFECGDKSRLESTYSQLPVNSPCNRYQDTLELSNDKENVTNSASASTGSE